MASHIANDKRHENNHSTVWILKKQKKLKTESEQREKTEPQARAASSTGKLDDPAATQKEEPIIMKERIPEYYSGPIFTFTMGTSITWLLYTLIAGEIRLTSNAIWVQLLLLMGIIIAKLLFFLRSGFATPTWLFVVHILIYAVYLVCVLIIEFYYSFPCCRIPLLAFM